MFFTLMATSTSSWITKITITIHLQRCEMIEDELLFINEDTQGMYAILIRRYCGDSWATDFSWASNRRDRPFNQRCFCFSSYLNQPVCLQAFYCSSSWSTLQLATKLLWNTAERKYNEPRKLRYWLRPKHDLMSTTTQLTPHTTSF